MSRIFGEDLVKRYLLAKCYAALRSTPKKNWRKKVQDRSRVRIERQPQEFDGTVSSLSYGPTRMDGTVGKE